MFLSIVIPVFNVEQYLVDCLTSCITQNIDPADYEIICIDDGSTDSSRDVLTDFSKRYSNIRVISQVNGGASSARNRGIEASSGDYIWFVDSDDFIKENVLGLLKKTASSGSPDLIRMGAYSFGDYSRGFSGTDYLYYQNSDLSCNRTSKIDMMLWRNLYKRSVMIDSGIRFDPEILTIEDALFHFIFDAEKKSSFEIPEVTYFYRMRASSLMTSHDDSKDYGYKLKLAGLFKNAADNGYGDKRISLYMLSSIMKRIMYLISRKSGKLFRKELRAVKGAGLFPLKIPRGFASYHSFAKSDSRFITKMYNRCYTRSGLAVIRIFNYWFRFKKKICK